MKQKDLKREMEQLKKLKKQHPILTVAFFVVSIICLVTAAMFIYMSTITLPDLSGFDKIKMARSTKIYDRTGEVLLYDIHKDIKRTVISFADMGDNIKKASIAIEDPEFYNHGGIRVKSIVRAVFANVLTGTFSQGGSTITQQVVKNTLLNQQKSITRKLKEWVLAIKLERVLDKEQIFEAYLNQNPYGGSVYGIEEGSQTFFGKHAAELDLAEAAYLAAIPQAPTYYSPYGSHKDKLDTRKNLVLEKMKALGDITEEEYSTALAEQVVFLPQSPTGIRAPHFVFYIKDYLIQKYGEDVVENGGLKVITTLDADLQQIAEDNAKKYAAQNEKDWNASNTALVAIDPKTGQILSMVGSRDYFDKLIDGNFNVSTAYRQPGSSFKPFVYATAFAKGYTPNTVVFDTSTEFNSGCDAYGHARSTSQSNCYMPDDYDGKYMGPINLRNALAQSRNIPAVKMLYLAGVDESIRTAKSLGITSLGGGSERYGLSLVLGGGEVSLLDMTSAYGVFANDGVRNPTTGILSITDATGQTLEEFKTQPYQAMDSNVAREISDVLSDNTARAPLFGSHSFFYFGENASVAGKTGTTNNNKDAWVLGYSPDIAVGVWSGNNDNTPMKKGSAISGPLWNIYMQAALKKVPHDSFIAPVIDDGDDLKPVLRGIWQGGDSFFVDTVSNKLATEFTPAETKKEVWIPNVHDILFWVQKSDPRGPVPENPERDSQFNNWETSAQNWWNQNKFNYPTTQVNKPNGYDDVHTENAKPEVSLLIPKTEYSKNDSVQFEINYHGKYDFKKADVYLGQTFVGTMYNTNAFTFPLSNFPDMSGNVSLRVLVSDEVYNKQEASVPISID